jgi:hypothetical protein
MSLPLIPETQRQVSVKMSLFECQGLAYESKRLDPMKGIDDTFSSDTFTAVLDMF